MPVSVAFSTANTGEAQVNTGDTGEFKNINSVP